MFDDIIANSARQAAEISRLMDEKNQREAEHRAKLKQVPKRTSRKKNCCKASLKLCANKTGYFLKIMKSSKQCMIPR